ncbi:hypothetical protein WJX74_007514 [Apatococcus lobatus]|uniref:Protein transport protein sec16 n=1 Tax=Apatococcus lobatus TaxID=904363 RepID=A0AAW1QUT7_9CHLO
MPAGAKQPFSPFARANPAPALRPGLGGGLRRPPLRTPPTFTPPPLAKPFVPPQPRTNATAAGTSFSPCPLAAAKTGQQSAQPTRSGAAAGTAKAQPTTAAGSDPSAAFKPGSQPKPAGASPAAPKLAGAFAKPLAQPSSATKPALSAPQSSPAVGHEVAGPSDTADDANADEDFFGSIASPQASITCSHPFSGFGVAAAPAAAGTSHGGPTGANESPSGLATAAAASDIFAPSVAASSRATAAAASDIFGKIAAGPTTTNSAGVSDDLSQLAATQAPSAPFKSTGNLKRENIPGSGTGSPSFHSDAAATSATASASRTSPHMDDAGGIAQIQAKADLPDFPGTGPLQDSAHRAQHDANHVTGPFGEATTDSSMPVGEGSPFQADQYPFDGNHSEQHAFAAWSQNGASAPLGTAGDSGSSFFAGPIGDAPAGEVDNNSFFDDLSGSFPNGLTNIEEVSAPVATSFPSAATAAASQVPAPAGLPSSFPSGSTASHCIPKSSSMLSLEGNVQQFTDLHEALAEGSHSGGPTFVNPGTHNSRHGQPHSAVWAPPSVSSHSRDSSMDSPLWPPAAAGAVAFHPPPTPAMASAFAGAAACKQGTSPLQPPWASQTAAQHSGYSEAAAHASSAFNASWAPQQLPTPFGSAAPPTASAPGGYWNAPKPFQAGQGHLNQPQTSQATHSGGSAAGVTGSFQHSPDGRPPCAILSFGFGGRGVLIRSQATAAEASAYGFGGGAAPAGSFRMQLLSMQGLAASIEHAQDSSDACSSPSTASANKDPTLSMLQQFPGPLTASTPKEKVQQYASQRAGGVEDEEPNSSSFESMQLLWKLLELQAAHHSKGKASAVASKSKALPNSLEVETAELLADTVAGSSGSVPLPSHPAAAAAGDASAVHAEVERLLMLGQLEQAFRHAMAGQCWGIALVLAKRLGDAAFGEAASGMATAAAAAGSPLDTALRAMGGDHASILPSASASPEHSEAGAVSAFQMSWQPRARIHDAAILDHWRQNLAVLAGSHSPGDKAVLRRLGEALLRQRQQLEAAHACFVVAGEPPQGFSAEACMCLVGGDHLGRPRTFACPAALQRTEILEWARPSGAGGAAAAASVAAAALPFKLVHAAWLLEYGLISQASAYCASLQSALASFQGNRVPPSLAVTRTLAADLSERIREHAAAHNIAMRADSTASLMGNVGRWLDRGINKLMGAPEGASSSNPTATRPPGVISHPGGNAAPLQGAAAAGSLPRVPPASTGALGLPSATGQPDEVDGASHRRSASESDFQKVDMHRRSSSASDAWTGKPAPPQPPQSSAVSSPGGPPSSGRSSPAPSSQASRQASIRSLFSRVGSIGQLLGSGAPSPQKEEQIGLENKFFYDKERKMWREEGKEVPLEAAPPPPPPIVPAFHNGQTLAAPTAEARSSSGPELTAGSSRSGSGALPPIPAPPVGSASAPRAGPRSRYVDPMNPDARPSASKSPAVNPLLPASVAQPVGPGRTPAVFTPGGGSAAVSPFRPPFQSSKASQQLRPGPFSSLQQPAASAGPFHNAPAAIGRGPFGRASPTPKPI